MAARRPAGVVTTAVVATMPILTFAFAILVAPPASAQSGRGSEKAPPADKETSPSLGRWRPLFRGIEILEARLREPRPLRMVALRVDLRDPDVDFLVTPPNGDRPGETDGMRTSTFLLRNGCQIAVNASPFSPVVATEGGPEDVLGLSVSRGERYSEASEAHGSLVITRERKARIVGPGRDTSDAYNAVGGFRVILEGGRNVARGDALHPRTAVGVSKDGRYLILLVIDGRQKGESEGATTAETASWLRQLGADDGLNLDGGGSTALVVADGKDGFRLLNRPIHAGIPGTERVTANHLGIFARPLPD